MSKTITAIILTKNEERNLSSCIESLRWVDDLIVVDSGSRDATIEMARELRARFFVHINEPFFVAKQRNWALDNTGIHTEWVLFIDADEIVTEPLRKEIIKHTSEAPEEITGFQLCPKFMFMGRWLKHTTGFPAWHDRLLRFGKVRWKESKWGGWERFETDGRIDKIYEPYLHYGFNKGIDAWIDRHQWNAQCEAYEFLEGPHEGLGSLLRRMITGDRRAFARIAERITGRFLFISPMMRFLYYYVVRLGFLDGKAGLVYSRMMAMYQFMIYLHFLEKKGRKQSCRFKIGSQSQ